jgi:hypothetical protein
MQDQVNATPAPKRVPWNKGKLTGGKAAAATQRRVPIDQSAVGRLPRRDYRVVTSAVSHPPRRSRPQRLPNRPCS